LGFLNVIGVVAASVYLVEVRPKLQQIDKRRPTDLGRR